jgi:protein-tyrosine-phosphatase
MRRERIQRNVLFLCEDNACLSQIAEASAKHLAPPRTRIFSAGIKPGIIPHMWFKRCRNSASAWAASGARAWPRCR